MRPKHTDDVRVTPHVELYAPIGTDPQALLVFLNGARLAWDLKCHQPWCLEEAEGEGEVGHTIVRLVGAAACWNLFLDEWGDYNLDDMTSRGICV